MARVPTDRVTVRLNRVHLQTIDALVEIGEIRTRTQAIAEAVRDWVRNKTVSAEQVRETAKKQVELHKLAAQMAEIQGQIAKLQRK